MRAKASLHSTHIQTHISVVEINHDNEVRRKKINVIKSNRSNWSQPFCRFFILNFYFHSCFSSIIIFCLPLLFFLCVCFFRHNNDSGCILLILPLMCDSTKLVNEIFMVFKVLIAKKKWAVWIKEHFRQNQL